MVKFKGGSGGENFVERVEEILYGDPTPDECELIAELHGALEPVGKKTIEDRLDSRFGDTVIADIGKPITLRWDNNRVDYKELRNFNSVIGALMMNEFAGRPHSARTVINSLVVDNPVTKYKDVLDDFGLEAMGREIRQHDMFLKPTESEFVAQQMRPRPKVIFELQYNVPRNADLRDSVRSMKERMSEGLMGQVADIVPIESRESVIVIPLKTLVDVTDFDVLDFNIEAFAETAAEQITGSKLEQSPRLDRAVATCDMIGE